MPGSASGIFGPQVQRVPDDTLGAYGEHDLRALSNILELSTPLLLKQFLQCFMVSPLNFSGFALKRLYVVIQSFKHASHCRI